MEVYNRRSGESITDYWVRLCENKGQYGLTYEQVALLMNEEAGTGYGESKWRKSWTWFDMGRKYERQHMDGSVANRILCLSDLHVPFQLPIETFAKYFGKVDTLVLNGDIGDCQAISKFPKSYRISPMEELIETRRYLFDLIVAIAPSKVVVTYGNHDIRFQSYLAKNLDTDILELMPQTSLELIFVDGFNHYDKRNRAKVWYPPLSEIFSESFEDPVEIEYTSNWWTQIGDAVFCHPMAFSSAMMQTAKKAMDYFRNEGYSFKQLIMSHTHRVGMYKIGNTTIYEQGCCCDVDRLHYGAGKLTESQKEGYIYLCQDIHGNTLQNTVDLVSLN